MPAALLMVMLLGLVLAVVLAPLGAIPGRRPKPSNERADLQARRESKYQEIRDAELDYEMGKLSAEDHQAIDGALRREALQILDRIEELERDADAEPTGVD
jgi:hypothetical protein